MYDKFVGQYLTYARGEANGNKLVTNLGEGAPELGDFHNKSKKTRIRITATKLFENEYNDPDKPERKQKIDRIINQIKESPVPPESEKWKTFNSFHNKRQFSFKCAGVQIEGTTDRLVYLYFQFKSKFDNIDYDVSHVILTDCGEPEKFHSNNVEYKLLKSNLDRKANSDRKFSVSQYKEQLLTQKNYSNNLINKKKMNLELNLVKSTTIGSKVGSLITRHRVPVETDTEAMDAVKAFIIDNMLTFNAAITDKVFTDKLSELTSLTVDELYNLKYVLTLNWGLDLIIVTVSDNEKNEYEIPKDITEYNVIDNLRSPLGFVKFATKIPISNRGGISELYKTIMEMYGFFESNLFASLQNPCKQHMDILHQTEQLTGVTPSAITNYLNSVIEYLGKEIYVILP